MGRGKRYEGENRLNIKKVISFIIAILVIIMFIISIQKILQPKELQNGKQSTVQYYPVYTNNKWGVINTNGDIIIEPVYDEMILIPNNDKALFICTYDINYDNGTYKTKVLNGKNQEILSDYEKIEMLDNYDEGHNIWYEKNILKVQKEGKYGIINFEGKELLKCEYDDITTLKGISNILLITKDGKVGLTNGLGEIIINAEYKEIQPLGKKADNGYIVIDDNNKCGIVSSTKTLAIEPKYEEIKKVSNNEIYVVKEEKWKVINANEETLFDSEFDDIIEINGENITVINDKKYGVVDLSKNEKIPAEYEFLKYCFGDYYIAQKDNKYGLIDLQNEIKIDIKYEGMQYRQEADFIEAENENYESVIYNRELQEKLTGIITEVNSEDGYIRIRQGDEYNYYNFKFEEKSNTEILKGKTLYLSKKDGKYGYIDKNGNVVVDYQYDDAKEQNNYNYAAIKKDGIWGSIDRKGKIVVEPKYQLDENTIIDFIGKWHLGKDLNMNYYTDVE